VFNGSAARLEQTTARLSHLADVTLYAVEPGPNELLPDAPWVWAAHTLPQTTSPGDDLSAFFARLSGQPTLVIERTAGQATEGLAKGSDHIARLWARDRVLALMQADPGNRAKAVALATQYRLVTPVSGAVALESQQQYAQARLQPVSQATVPTVPEPHEWALAIVACLMMVWLIWRHRSRVAAVA
jgi:hypothetical protein